MNNRGKCLHLLNKIEEVWKNLMINLQFESVSLDGVDVLFTDDVTFSPANVWDGWSPISICSIYIIEIFQKKHTRKRNGTLIVCKFSRVGNFVKLIWKKNSWKISQIYCNIKVINNILSRKKHKHKHYNICPYLSIYIYIIHLPFVYYI